MVLMRIYVNGQERMTIYKEGGCQFEQNLPGIGWIVDNDACQEWRPTIKEAMAVLTQVAENLEVA